MDLKLGGCVLAIQRGFYFPGLSEVILGSSWGHVSIKGLHGLMDLKLGGCTHHSERIFKGPFGVIWGHPGIIYTCNVISIKGCMDLKLGGCSPIQRVFERYFQVHQRSSLGHLGGHISIKIHMALKLGGYSHHLEGNFYRYFLDYLRSSRGHLRSYQGNSSYRLEIW